MYEMSVSIKERYSFIKRWINNPKQVGALFQTSQKFVDRIVKEIDWSGYVIELGAGLGNVTMKINKILPSSEKFAAVEIDHIFCKDLRKKFDQINIVEGSAAELEILLPHMIGKVSTIVSVLPMLSLSKELRYAIMESMSKMLSPTGFILQGTYGIKPSIPCKDRMNVTRLSTTWYNMPPITLHRYKTFKH